MEFGIRCVTVPDTQIISGNLSRSRVFYPDADTLVKHYQGKDRMVAWMDAYTEDIGSDNWFFPGWYNYVGELPGALQANLGGNYNTVTSRIYLGNETLGIIRKWKYDN